MPSYKLVNELLAHPIRRHDDLEQGSFEWHEHRAKHRNASEAGAVMDCMPDWGMSRYQLHQLKMNPRITPSNPLFEHGHRVEPIARQHVMNVIGNEMAEWVESPCYARGEYAASLDLVGIRVDGSEVFYEIKCPYQGLRSAIWGKSSAGEIVEYYDWQMVQQHAITGIEEAYLVVYIDADHCIILPHPGFTKKRVNELLKAWEDLFKNPPEPPFKARNDAEFEKLVDNVRMLRSAAKEAQDELAEAEKKLKDAAGDENVEGFGCKVQTIERKGSVDYGKVPELKTVDLEQYRKKGTTYKKITFEKEAS